MSNKKDFRFLKSQIAKIESTLSRVEEKVNERMKKIRSDLQKLTSRSTPPLSKAEKISKAIEKIFQVYKKFFNTIDYKESIGNSTFYIKSTSKDPILTSSKEALKISRKNIQTHFSEDTLIHFHDLLKYVVMKESGKTLGITEEPKEYFKNLNAAEKESLSSLLQLISYEGYKGNDLDTKKIDKSLKEIGVNETKGISSWQKIQNSLEGVVLLLEVPEPHAMKSILRSVSRKGDNKTGEFSEKKRVKFVDEVDFASDQRPDEPNSILKNSTVRTLDEQTNRRKK